MARDPFGVRPFGVSRFPSAAGVSLLLLALSLLFPLGVSQAQSSAFSTASNDWQGLSSFIRAAQSKWGRVGVKVAATLDYGLLSADDSVIIVAPEAPLDAESLTALLAAGGRVAILDDFGKSPAFLERFGIRRLASNRQPQHSLRSDPDLPVALPSIENVAGAREGRHPMALGVERVVTNHPMYFQHPDLTPVLEVPFADGTSATLAVTGIISGRGRLLALGDPSIFINLMLRYPGNRALADGLLDYLMERDPGETGPRRLWIVSGAFTQVGSFGDSPSLSRRIREGLSALSEATNHLSEEGLPGPLSLAVAALLALALLSREMRRNFSPRLSLLPYFARPRLLAAQTGPASRALVLGGRHSSPLLPVIEMDAALREALEIRLQISSGLGAEELQRQLLAKGLSPDDAESLADLLSETRRLGGSLASGRAAHPSSSDLQRLHRRAMHLLSAIRQAEHQK